MRALLIAVGLALAACQSPSGVTGETSLRVATWNIRHGRGMDGLVDLERTARVLHTIDADIVGLQEVDRSVRRSGGVDQAAFIGERLDMHSAFGAFMAYDGGDYGMAILSRFPIAGVEEIALPTGNEPRIALAARVAVDDRTTIIVVNVHFDWVDDDRFRFAQATALASWIDGQRLPILLLGDFNDGPESRTLGLIRDRAVEAAKTGERATFPAQAPDREIDYLFGVPPKRWTPSPATVQPERDASDHRPVVAEWRLLGRDDASESPGQHVSAPPAAASAVLHRGPLANSPSPRQDTP